MISKINRLVYASLFLALALVLPFLTGQIPQIGAMLTPMYFPVLLCGFLCGWQWGIAVGFSAPLLRSVLFGMPVMYPMAVCMALELATYAAVAGMLYRVFPQKRRFLYVSLIISMILGRLVWGLARFLCAGLDISTFGLSAFWTGAVAMSVPGILLQLLIVPVLVIVSEKYISGKR
jgi:thiamine transporter ThiT